MLAHSLLHPIVFFLLSSTKMTSKMLKSDLKWSKIRAKCYSKALYRLGAGSHTLEHPLNLISLVPTPNLRIDGSHWRYKLCCPKSSFIRLHNFTQVSPPLVSSALILTFLASCSSKLLFSFQLLLVCNQRKLWVNEVDQKEVLVFSSACWI